MTRILDACGCLCRYGMRCAARAIKPAVCVTSGRRRRDARAVTTQRRPRRGSARLRPLVRGRRACNRRVVAPTPTRSRELSRPKWATLQEGHLARPVAGPEVSGLRFGLQLARTP